MDIKDRVQVAVLNINNEKFLIYEGVNTIGRNREAVVNIKHMNISQNHAIIATVGGQHFISDLKSSNGSFYEGSKMVPYKIYHLKNNIEITLGNLLGRYVSHGPFLQEDKSQVNSFSNESLYGCSTQILECPAVETTDIHDLPTQQLSWTALKPTSRAPQNLNLPERDTHITKSNDAVPKDDLSVLCEDYNDEHLPLLENNDNFTEVDVETEVHKVNSIHEEATQVMDLTKSSITPTLEDDELTDCEDGGTVNLRRTSSSAEITTVPMLAAKPTSSKSKILPEFDSDSSNSMEFLKFDKSTTKEAPEGSITDKVRTLESDSDTEKFAFKRNKKSSMVISTQDLGEDDVNSEIDTSVIKKVQPQGDKDSNYDDSCAETEIRLIPPNQFEDSIPATQNLTTDLNESDFIPATQEVNKYLIEESQTKNKNTGSSEESFKLGLTELLMEPSQNISDSRKPVVLSTENDTAVSKSLHENVDNFAISVQNVINKKSNRTLTDDIFLAPTQKMNFNEPDLLSVVNIEGNKSPSSSQVDTEIYDAPTQPICLGVNRNDKLVFAEKYVPQETSLKSLKEPTGLKVPQSTFRDLKTSSVLETEINFDEPTQKITFLKPDTNLNNKHRNELVVAQSTFGGLEPRSVSRKEAIFDEPTQEITSLKPDANLNNKDHNELGVAQSTFADLEPRSFSRKEAIFDEPTQEITTLKPDKNLNNKHRNDLVVAQSTFGDLEPRSVSGKEAIFDEPTQKVNTLEPVSDLENKHLKKISHDKEGKKTFSFKKKICNLDASLSVLANDGPTKIGKCNIVLPNADLINTCQLSKLTVNIANHNIPISNKNNVVPSNSKKETKVDHKTNSLNITDTSSSLNKSVGMPESKTSKTRRSAKAIDIQVSVPRTRKSMSISTIEETSVYEFKDRDDSKSVTNLVDGSRGVGKRKRLTTKDSGTNVKEISERSTRKPKGQHKTISKLSDSEEKRNESDISDYPSTSGKNRVSKQNKQSADQSEPELKNSARRKMRSDSINNNVPVEETSKIETKASTSSKKCKVSLKGKKRLQEEVIHEAPVEKEVSPKKRKIDLSESLQRDLRKQRPKVVFTMMDNPQLESLIKQLGGSVVESVETCTVLVTERIKRSQKLLTAIGLGKPICSPKWITDSKRAHEFLDPYDYILTDPEAERKWDFSLEESLNRSREHKLLQLYSFHIQVTNGADVLKGAIESCGGKCLSKIPTAPLENTYIISSPDNASKYKKILKKHSDFKVIEAEAIFDGVLRQELRFTKHFIS